MIKLMVASDIHGSAYYCKKMLEEQISMRKNANFDYMTGLHFFITANIHWALYIWIVYQIMAVILIGVAGWK